MRMYDKEELISLVRKAMGERNIKSFAEDSGLSKDYVSRLLNGRFENSPKRSTLTKIASATDKVTLDELLRVSGYYKSAIPKSSSEDMTRLKAALLSSLASTDISWSIDKGANSYPLSICCNDTSFKKWHFFFLDQKTVTPPMDRLFAYYINLLFRKIPAEDKISIVTENSAEYELYLENIPVNLAVNLSVISVDTEKLTVKKEAVLSSAGNFSASDIPVFDH